MPTWRRNLPASNAHMGFEIHRTPQAGQLASVVTSDDLLIADTHYWNGRTTPCERPATDDAGHATGGECPACLALAPYRTHVYVAAFDHTKNEHYIFECTAHAARAFDDYRKQTGTLRGCLFRASRPKGNPNSKVVIACQTANMARLTIPTAPDVKLALSVIWRLPLTGMAIEHDTHFVQADNGDRQMHGPTIKTRRGPIDQMRNPPDNAPGPAHISDIIAGNGQKKKETQPA